MCACMLVCVLCVCTLAVSILVGITTYGKKEDGSSLFDDEDDDAEGGLFSTKKKSLSGKLKVIYTV